MIEELLLKLGKTFRSLVLHSDGRWTVNSGKRSILLGLMVTGHTPEQALQKLLNKAIDKAKELNSYKEEGDETRIMGSQS